MQPPSLKPIVPAHLQPAPRRHLPWWKPERLRSGAAATGYAVWACFTFLVPFGIYRLAADPGGVDIPFTSNDGLTKSELRVNVQSGADFHGDGATMQVGQLTGSRRELQNAVTNKVSYNLVWFHRPFDERDRKAFEFVSLAPEYQKAAPFVKEVESGDFYFAYRQLQTYDDGRVGDAGIWLFSPDKMLLVFLNSNLNSNT